MPSTTTSKTECSATATATRSWFSSRPPRRLKSAYSTCKACSVCLVHCGESYITWIAGGIRGDRAAFAQAATDLSLIRDHDQDHIMIASMTGFARRESTGPWGSLICELRSVNHRFLESSLRLPEELRSLDPEIRQQFGRGLKRGKIDCTITYRRTDIAARALDLDHGALDQLLGRVQDVVGRAGAAPVSVDALEVLRWPGVSRDTDTGTEDLIIAARTLAAATVDDLAEARSREGARLGELIEQRCAGLATLVT